MATRRNGKQLDEVKVEETTATKVLKKKVEIDRNEMIPCRNATQGSLIYVSSKTGATILWQEFGDIEYIDYGELLTMRASQPRFINEPWLIIEDEVVAENLSLDKLYAKIVPVDELEGFFSLPIEAIQEKLRILPNGSKNLVADKARELIVAGQLYDIRVIKVLEKELHVDLQD